ncbi:MAG: CoA-binding protein [Deltaproteobacteria bacterium]|nr:CoA-binding protein [Deltaproteobacteria bacterium]MBW2052501.1 CoA-binding protein [Deltaproteobacteria bacterium]MBW2141094.1 CoA-binding protein [Deltaproteobacteria bacterium]MBW2324217.1 CoA-binding protein [Deltaproteobacteria bacterium]
MVNVQELMNQMDTLFHPKSVAVVGVPRGMKTGKLFLMALLDQEFPGPIYPVHPQAEEIDGLKAYPSVSAIPGPVDLAIILIPHDQTLSVIKECAAKGVKGAVLFTAGYKETGTSEGAALEKELVRIARSSGMRLIGPNCMGLYAPKSGLAFFPQLSREPGPVGLISHSGSLANILARMATQKGLRFSKAVSLGNECDLTSADFLAYLGNDPETRLIAVYLEGINNGPFFLDALTRASLKKPVILWKVGLTPEGSQAASSHTGALAGSWEIWEGVVRQSGAVPVVGFEAWVDALMGFSLLPSNLGDRLAIISGPGGLAVSAAEACGSVGLRLAELSPQTRSSLAKTTPPTGTSLRNPIDVGLTASLDMDIYIQAARTAAQDPNVDAVVVVGIGMSPEANKLYTEAMIQVREEFKKPFVIVSVPGFDSSLAQSFCEAGLPFFETSERAMRVYAQIRRYQQWRQQRL